MRKGKWNNVKRPSTVPTTKITGAFIGGVWGQTERVREGKKRKKGWKGERRVARKEEWREGREGGGEGERKKSLLMEPSKKYKQLNNIEEKAILLCATGCLLVEMPLETTELNSTFIDS